jgi:hypothetical protein
MMYIRPWFYLSGFYYTGGPGGGPGRGNATATLQAAIAEICNKNGPIILCCEPILGTDPRSLTAKNADLSADDRYDGLCNYYRRKFGLTCDVPIDCTLRTEMTGHGRRWSLADRKFMWSGVGLARDQKVTRQEPAIVGDSIKPDVLLT